MNPAGHPQPGTTFVYSPGGETVVRPPAEDFGFPSAHGAHVGPASAYSCEACGRTPAQTFHARRHVGMVVLMRNYQVKLMLCRDCATRLLIRWTGRSLLQGWWGAISLVAANPATILLNLWNLGKARRMDRPYLSSAPSPAQQPRPWGPSLDPAGPQQEPATTLASTGGGGTAFYPPVEQALVESPAEKRPLLVASAPRPVAHRRAEGPLGLALAAGAAVAFAGGLLWAGVVISTGYDVGFLAWFVGMATGATVFRLYGASVRGLPRAIAGLLAVGAIVAGKYVIFVHEVKKTLGSALAQDGISVGYLDSRQLGIFIHNFGTIVRPIYYLWMLIALVGALMAAEGRKAFGRRRTAR